MPWPEEALLSVASNALTSEDYKLGNHTDAIVNMFKTMHQAVEVQSALYLDRMRRHAYVTPTSYLELLSSYTSLLLDKRKQLGVQKNRLTVGVDKIKTTKEQVAGMQKTLTDLQPQLTKTQAEVDEMMIQITADKADAAETKALVEVEETSATVKAAETKEIADDAQKDLDEALPALDEAVKCLSELKKSDIEEVRGFKIPTPGVKLTCHAICLMFEVKPVKVKDPDNAMGPKISDYFQPCKDKLFKDAKGFIKMMIEFDKDNIKATTITKIAPFVENPDFTPVLIAKASNACKAMCMWVRAMYKYHTVATNVEPKRKLLAAAQITLDETLAKLADAQSRLKAVMDRLEELETNYNGAVKKKEDLAFQVEQCKTRLDSAMKLIGGLGGEEVRWIESVSKMEVDFVNLDGDVLVAAGSISYLGVFTSEYRNVLVKEWTQKIAQLKIPHTPGCSLIGTMGDPVEFRHWAHCGLPTDELSAENGIMISSSKRWPLLIDPQGQGNAFIRRLGKEESKQGVEICKPTDKNFLRSLENGIRFGKWVLLENVLTTLDAALEPVLQQAVFKQAGQDVIRLGENTIPYSDTFRFFMTSKLPNPHYAPEVCVKVTLLNFAITPQGLEEQLLGALIRTELPEVEEKNSALTLDNARMKKELADIQKKILDLLTNCEGNILDDVEIIDTLDVSKKTSNEINTKLQQAAITSKEITASRESLRPVAFRASTLFFCLNSLAIVDPMYQYSLKWFIALFIIGITDSEQTNETEKRIVLLNDFFTSLLYDTVSRSLFERHKLLFSFLLTIQIMQSHDEVDGIEWRFLISGQSSGQVEVANPDPSWIESRPWTEITTMSTVASFDGFAASVAGDIVAWRAYFDSDDPHRHNLPGKWNDSLNELQKLCVLRCFRPDIMMSGMQDFITLKMGQKYIEPPPFNLPLSYGTSTPVTPLIFVLSIGTDPMKVLQTYAEDRNMRSRFQSVSLGQGQGPKAQRMIEDGCTRGEWIFLQNAHLCISWMPTLEQLVEEFDEGRIHSDFRLWLSSMPSEHFPVSILQDGVKMTNEPPKGLRANLRQSYFKLDDEKLNLTEKPKIYMKLLFALSFFHAIIIERKKFGALGWNIPYAFNETDLAICKSQLSLYLDKYEEVPFNVLQMLTSFVNYGGRVTDDKDLRTIDVILESYYREDTLTDNFNFSGSGTYFQPPISDGDPHNGYMDYITSLPINPAPEAFGMHNNANITSAQNETYDSFNIILTLQPRQASGAGKSREDVIAEQASGILESLPILVDEEAVFMKYPTRYEESMNTVLVQEVKRYNNLLAALLATLPNVLKAVKGELVMSGDLEQISNAIFNQWVPTQWSDVGFNSLKPLGAWTIDVLDRLKFMKTWIDDGIPKAFWISGFFFPQAFTTGTLQNYARKHQLPIDTISNVRKQLEIDQMH